MIQLVGCAADRDSSGEVAGHDVARRPADCFDTQKQITAYQRPAGERQQETDGRAPPEHPDNELVHLTARKRIDSHHQILAVG